MYYDNIDMQNSYRSGFWIGAVAGLASMFGLGLLVGLFLYT